MGIPSPSIEPTSEAARKGRSSASFKLRVLIGFSALIVLGFQISLFLAMQRFQVRKPDFASLYQAGRKIDHERFPWLVARFPGLNSEEYSVQLNAHEFPADTMHPPYEMVLYATLALLKFHTAYLVWWACNIGFLFLAAFRLWPRISRLQGSYPYLLILIATFFPVLVAFVQGQNSILLLALLTVSYDSFERHSEFRAGFILAMGMFKFLVILPMVLWLLLEKRWKSLLGFVTGCFCLLLTAIWLVGFSGIGDYVRALAGFGKKAPEQPGSESIMPNLRGLFYALGSRLAPEIVLMALTLISSIFLFIWIDSCLHKYSKDLGMRFSMQILLTALTCYHFYPHDGAILLLPMMLLLDRALQGTDRRFRTCIVVCLACSYLVPLAGGLTLGMPVVAVSSLVLLFLARGSSLSPAAAVRTV